LNQEISLFEFQRAFTRDVLSEINNIIFCGDIGDPIYARDFLKIIEYIKISKYSINIVIVTNGSYKSREWWIQLGSLLQSKDKVTFSIDGWDQDSNEKYRVNSNFESIVNGARALRSSTSAQLQISSIYFNFNQDHMDKIKQLAIDLDFDIFRTVQSSKFNNQYIVNGVDNLLPRNEYVVKSQYKTNYQSLNYRDKTTVPVNVYQKQHKWAKCANGEKEMFVNVEGLVLPCPWFNSGYLENDFITKYKDKINIKTRTLKEIVEDPLWNEMYTRFEAMPLEICKLKCRDCNE
jgi:MoaA/NifB/PqqE/SkfB family radical SAM enzyme